MTLKQKDNRMPESYLNATEACARLGSIFHMTLWRHLNSFDLCFPRPIHVRKRRLFREADVANWLKEQGVAR